MAARVDNGPEGDGDQGSLSRSPPPSEEGDRNPVTGPDEDRTLHPDFANMDAQSEPAPMRLRDRAGVNNPNPAPSMSLGTLDHQTMSALSQLMSHMNKESKDISRGTVPKWDRGKEPFVAFEQDVNMWLESHGLEYLLKRAPDPADAGAQRHHKQAKVVIIGQLSRDDKTTCYSFQHLHQAWSYLKAKYHPSDKADVDLLWNRWEKLQKGRRSVKEYHSEIISIYERLKAYNKAPEDYSVRRKLFDIDETAFDTLRYDLEDKTDLTYRAIMARYVAHEQRYKLRAATSRPDGAGSSRRGGGAPRPPRGGPPADDTGDAFPAVLAVAKATDVCRKCGKQGHFMRDCPDLHPEVRKHLQENAFARKAAGARRPRR